MSETNIRLHQLPHFKAAVCVKCSRGYPETILNLEGAIHHRTGWACIDVKSCRRAQRKAASKPASNARKFSRGE